MLISNKIWEFRQQDIEKSIIDDISIENKISPITARVLYNRGLREKEAIKKFLKPDAANFYDPFLMKDMEKAVERVIKSIEAKEKIMIYGDYDVDGITSTSILYSYLKEQGANADFYIPDRIEEGYGLSKNSIDKLISKGVNLIITVDCGITAVEEVEYIKSHGIEIIITDHHECKDIIPSALAVVNPKQKDCGYPYKELAGVGVVFKLIQALAKKMNIENVIEKFVEIVALGTIADVVPLLDENRVIVKYGLDKIAKTTNLGIQSLINISGLQGKPITSTSIGYILAPRINAAGRIGDARRGVELFISSTKEEADQIALELDLENKNRQQTENVILTEAMEMLESNEEYLQNKVIVLASENWHHGVIGIVASRITEKFYKPTILISLDGGEGKGSARSIPGFNMFEGLSQCTDLLEKFGGHELAAGLSIKKDKIDEFRKKLNLLADDLLSEDDFYPRVKIDAEISRENLKFSLVNELKMLEPYGMGNPSPVFLYNNLKILDCRTVGDNKHIKLRMEDESLYIDGIGFNLGEFASKVDIFDRVDVAGSIEINIWNSQEKLQLNVKDIRTNHEIIFKEKYYSTLEESIFSDIKIGNVDKGVLGKINIYNGNIISLIENGKKNIVLINTLKGARNFIDTLKSEVAHTKERFRVCYNFDPASHKNIAVINPHFEDISFEEFDNVVMYDLCFNESQYAYLANKSKNLYVMNDFAAYSNNIDLFDEIIPQREELIKVYQYMKSRNWNQMVEGDIFSLTREIAISYNIEINSLKLRKIFEIFEEMNLVKMDVEGEKYKIELIKQDGVKVNIQASKGLSKLLKIKDEFDYFISTLKQQVN